MASSSDQIPPASDARAGAHRRPLERLRTAGFATALAAMGGGALGTLLDRHGLENGAALLAMVGLLTGAGAGELADRR